MEFFRIRRDIPFMRHALVLNAISFITFVAAVFFLVTRGLHLSIEFTGGTVIEVAYTQPADIAKVRSTVEGMNAGDAQVQNFGSSRDVLIRLPLREGVNQGELVGRVIETLCRAEGGAVEAQQGVSDKGEAVSRQVCLTNGAEPLKLQRSEFVGPQVGAELAYNGIIAVLVVLAGIMIYIGLRFEWKFAVATVVGEAHDVIVTLGFFAIMGYDFDLTVLAAILAVDGYSVNDKIVVFDRVRELFRATRKDTPQDVINRAINSTLSRTIMTSLTTLLTCIALYIWGGPTLEGFAMALIVGIVVGTASTIFFASPLLLTLGVTKEDLMPKAKDDAELNRRP